MKHWGTLFLAGTLVITSGLAQAEPETMQKPETMETGMAMPIQVPDTSKLAGVQKSMPPTQSQALKGVDEEKSRISVDMDQTAEKLEAKLYELKTESLTTKGTKKRFRLHQKIKKLEGQKASLGKLHQRVSKARQNNIDHAKQDWTKLKASIGKQLGMTE